MAEKHTTEKSSVGKGYAWVTSKQRPNGAQYLEGMVVTPHGIVDVYSENDFTMMNFVWGGTKYRRTWKKQFTERGLSRLAKTFAKEIAETNK